VRRNRRADRRNLELEAGTKRRPLVTLILRQQTPLLILKFGIEPKSAQIQKTGGRITSSTVELSNPERGSVLMLKVQREKEELCFKLVLKRKEQVWP
jgi:hypothetical protein